MKKKPMEMSISRRLMLSLAIVTVSLFTVIGATTYVTIMITQTRALEKNAASTLKRFSDSLIDPVWNLNIEEVKRLSDIYLQPENITGINIKFWDKTVSLSKPGAGGSQNTITKILSYNGEQIGTASIIYTDSLIISRLNATAALAFTGLIMLLTAGIFSIKFIIKNALERPVKKLSDNIEIIASGGYNHVLDMTRQSELNVIVAAINNMSNQIFARDSQIKLAGRLLTDVIESITSMIAAADLNGMITHANTAFCSFSSCPENDAPGHSIFSAAPFLEKYLPAVDEVKRTGVIKNFESETFPFAPEKYFRLSIYPLISDGINGFIIVIEDITELTRKEEQLRQAQKLETIGVLAGGLAHDFNNALGGITGVVSLLKHQLAEEKEISKDEINEMLDLIDESGGRAAEMVQQLLGLTRLEKLTPEKADLRDAVMRVIKVSSKTFDKSVNITFDLPDSPAIASIDMTGIEQVLFNLAINAVHSMTIMRGPGEKQGGELAFSLKDLNADRHFILSHPEAKEITYRLLSVRDTGIGISRVILPKIFEPFFTTKQKGSGTGLGLSMVYNIIKFHGGFIDVYSEQDAGSVFNIYIPALEAGEADETRAVEPVPRGTGLILVVDDDPVMRLITESILRESGYDIITAFDGKEAVETYRSRRDDIGLVLLDLVMPVMNGLEAFVSIKEINPAVKVLMMSGFRQDPRIDTALKEGARNFIQKPFTFRTLATAVHAVMQG